LKVYKGLWLRKHYFILTLLLVVIEVIIGTFAHDDIIRPYGGDYLAVILLYCFIQSFFRAPVLATAMVVLLFSYLVEGLQYRHLADRLGLARGTLARTLVGDYFSWVDIGCYTAGILTVLLLERYARSGITKCSILYDSLH
jgi:Protein of unknown function (DUF2809)